MSGDEPLLTLERCCIGTREQLTLSGIELRSEAQHQLLVDDSMSLFRVLAGRGPETLLSGRATLLGHDVSRREHHAICGVLPVEAALPPRWQLRHYLSWAARLSGSGKTASRERVDTILTQLGLNALGKQPLRVLGATQRMALRFAAAIVHQPQVLLLEVPGRGWGNDEVALIHQWLATCCNEIRLMLCAPTLPSVGSSWLEMATELCVFHDGALLAQESPGRSMAEATMYTLTVTRGAEALAAQLEECGIALRGGPQHFTALLPTGHAPHDLLHAASETGAAIVQLEPIFTPTVL